MFNIIKSIIQKNDIMVSFLKNNTKETDFLNLINIVKHIYKHIILPE